MTWIKTIPFEEAEGKLKRIYEKVTGPNNNVDNILMVHSLRPHTLEGHMAIYKNVIHNSNNTIPKWFLETLGVYVSMLNNCDYCVDHHFEGLKRLLNDAERATQIKDALTSKQFEGVFSSSEIHLLNYADQLTMRPDGISKELIDQIKQSGITDGELLEANQVAAYFNYANRTVLGLGVDTDGDVLGLSPNSDESGNWSHK